MKPKWLLLAGVLCGATAAAGPAVTLKDAYRDAFLVGAAVGSAQIAGADTAGLAVLETQFDAITPENDLKWERVHPAPDRYDFAMADRYVDLGVKNRFYIVGHVLVWHSQTPAWVFRHPDGTPLSREALLKRMRDHIFTVVGRYKGRIAAWDVVNEAISDDGGWRASPWYKIIGEDYITKAFQYAHEADPAAELIYNDYGIANPAKRAGVIALIKKLKAEGVPVTTVGIQGHYDLTWPGRQMLEDTINGIAELGVKVAVTELDVSVLPPPDAHHSADVDLTPAPGAATNPYPDGLPDAVQRQLAQRYGDLFALFYRHRAAIDRVTLWGIDDKDSWKNNWPVKGRSDYPLLFGRDGKPKPAFEAVLRAAAQ